MTDKTHRLVREDIFWVGALDFDLRVFDIIMYSDYGTSYNSYIVKGTKKTILFEVVKDKFFDEFLERLKGVCSLDEIDAVVVSHTEPDHAGAMGKLLQLRPDLEVIGTPTALRYLKQVTNMDFTGRPVKDHERMDIGGKTLEFLFAPLLHWPDTMYTYIHEAKTLVTCDSFGCHFASDKVFNDQIIEMDDLMTAYKYYFDVIMGPFKANVLRALDKIENLEIETICNGHGPVLRTDIQKFIGLYREWSQPTVTEKHKLVIGYLSSYGYTKKIAEKLHEGAISNPNVEVKFYNLEDISTENFVAELNDAKGMMIGGPTFLSDALPPIHSILGNLNPIIHKGMLAFAFGTYGWSGEGVDNVVQRLCQLKLKQPFEGFKVNFNPDENDLNRAYEIGVEFSTKVQLAKNARIQATCDDTGHCEIEII